MSHLIKNFQRMFARKTYKHNVHRVPYPAAPAFPQDLEWFPPRSSRFIEVEVLTSSGTSS